MSKIDSPLTFNNSFLSEEAKTAIYFLFKIADKDITDLVTQNKVNNPDFIIEQKEFIFAKLIAQENFTIADELLNKKIYQFDQKIAKFCCSNIALKFNQNAFDYWIDKVKKMEFPNYPDEILRSFWDEFLSLQFIFNDDFNDNILKLNYVFEKASFYTDLNKDMSNGYLIKERANFFKEKINNLNNSNKNELFHQIGLLCGNYYPHAQDLFKEEFENYPIALQSFSSSTLSQKLEQYLEQKKITTKTKI